MRVHRVFAELLGTVILAFAVTMKRGDPVAMGAGLWSATIATGFVSGGQFNPAITTSIFLVNCALRQVHVHEVLENVAFLFCHFLGAILGSLLSWNVLNETWKLMIPDNTSVLSGYLAETCGTAILVLVAQVCTSFRDDAFVGTIAVASAYYLGGLTLRTISGGCLNPAIGVGADFVDAVNHGGSRAAHMWIYVCAPFTGALLAAGAFVLLKPELDKVHKARIAVKAKAASKK